VRFGGLGICNPADVCDQQYKELLHGVVALILDQQSLLPIEVVHHQNELLSILSLFKINPLILSSCPSQLRWAMECCQEKKHLLAFSPSSGLAWFLT